MKKRAVMYLRVSKGEQKTANQRPDLKRLALGRPTRRIDVKRARELKDKGASLRAIAEQLKVPTTTLHRAMRRSEKGSPPTRG